MKKFKYLYTNGCSHTAGGGMEEWKNEVVNAYSEKFGIKITNKRELAWPKLLADKLGLKLRDYSQSGAGAERVWRETWEYIENNFYHKLEDTLFILEIPSFWNRIDIKDKNKDWLICNLDFDSNANISNISMVKSYDERQDNIEDLEYKKKLYLDYLDAFSDYNSKENEVYFKFAGLMSYFIQNNLSFFIIPNGVIYQAFEYKFGVPINNHIFNVVYGGKEYNEFTALSNNNKMQIREDLAEYIERFPGLNDYHPGPFAHKIWADEVGKFIEKYFENKE